MLSFRESSIFKLSTLFFAFVVSMNADEFWVNAVLATIIFFIILNEVEGDSPTHLLFFLGFSIFIYSAAIVNGFYNNTSFELFFASAIGVYLFLEKTKGLQLIPVKNNSKKYALYFLLYAFFVIFSSLLGGGVLFFLGPMIMFYGMSLVKGEKIYNFIISLIGLVSFFVFYFYGWDGFGRTVVFGYLISAVICFLILNEFRINKFLFVIVGLFGSLLTVSRKSQFSGFSAEKSLTDSSFGPYGLAVTFIDRFEQHGYDFSGLFDQLIFTFLSFVPRDLWPGKPFGFGFHYVVENMDDYLIDAGHSIASTLIADHFYYLGFLGLGTGFLIIWFLAFVIRYTYKLKIFNGWIHLIFASNMMVFAWGGMTSYSARVIFPMIGLVPLIILTVFLKRKKY